MTELSGTRGSLANLYRSNPTLFSHDTSALDPKKRAAAQNQLEKKRASLDARHRYLIEKFAAFIDEKPATIENSLLAGNKLDILNDFLTEGGSRKVMFFWQSGDGRESKPSATNPASGRGQPQLVVTNGSREVLTGQGCFFLRTTTKAIAPATIHTDISFGTLTPALLPSLTTTVKHVLLPALKAQDNWGALSGGKDESVMAFMEVLEKFVEDLDVAMLNLGDSVVLHECTVDLEAYKRPQDYPNAAHNPELIEKLEGRVDLLHFSLLTSAAGTYADSHFTALALVTEWLKQIDAVLAESEQMRKEADDIGPNAELAHWKARMVKFNSITDQLKSLICKKVVGILHATKMSRGLLKSWKEVGDRVTDAANESKVGPYIFCAW